MPLNDDKSSSLSSVYYCIAEWCVRRRCSACCASVTGKCKKALSSTNYNELEGDIVCTTCHRRHSTTAVTSQRLSHTATDSTGPTNTSPAAATADDAASQSLSHTVKERSQVKNIKQVLQDLYNCCTTVAARISILF